MDTSLIDTGRASSGNAAFNSFYFYEACRITAITLSFPFHSAVHSKNTLKCHTRLFMHFFLMTQPLRNMHGQAWQTWKGKIFNGINLFNAKVAHELALKTFDEVCTLRGCNRIHQQEANTKILPFDQLKFCLFGLDIIKLQF